MSIEGMLLPDIAREDKYGRLKYHRYISTNI